MSSTFPVHQFARPKLAQENQTTKLKRRRSRSVAVRCCKSKLDGSKNYYELLGVSVDSNPQEIKEAYRKLQKKYHPDIAGEQGHERTLMLNKAYKVLMREDLRINYDASIGRIRIGVQGSSSITAHSSWNGPLRPQALFVDENTCVGCRECVHHAAKTFTMDDFLGTARVKVQFGDDESTIQVSVDSCPVNCIHWVETDDLAALEYLIQPQPREGRGVFGQGWERPNNVFMAAKSFNKLKRQAENQERKATDEETPAQAQARETASMELKFGSLSRVWSWINKTFT